MPRMTVETSGPREPTARRYRIKATGQTGAVVSYDGNTGVGRVAAIGSELIHLIDLCDDVTGEVRTFRAEFLEQIDVDSE